MFIATGNNATLAMGGMLGYQRWRKIEKCFD